MRRGQAALGAEGALFGDFGDTADFAVCADGAVWADAGDAADVGDAADFGEAAVLAEAAEGALLAVFAVFADAAVLMSLAAGEAVAPVSAPALTVTAGVGDGVVVSANATAEPVRTARPRAPEMVQAAVDLEMFMVVPFVVPAGCGVFLA